MPTRSSRAEWHGTLRDGHGHMSFGNGAYDGEFSFGSRFMELEAEESGVGTNPEELIAAAHAGCFSMQLSGLLSKDGHPPRRISTTVRVKLEVGQQGADITSIELETEGGGAGHRRRNVFQNGRNREGHMSGIEGAQGSEDEREGDPAVSLRRQLAGASCCDCRKESCCTSASRPYAYDQ